MASWQSRDSKPATPFHFCFLQLTFALASSDFDECGDDPEAGCTHFCHNFVGGYYCSCRHGYHLKEDQRTCTGTNACTGQRARRRNRKSKWEIMEEAESDVGEGRREGNQAGPLSHV